MSYDSSSQRWRVTITVPSSAASSVDFVFTDGTNWDNNGTKDYHVTVDPQSDVSPAPSPDTTPIASPSPNQYPVADADPDQTINAGDAVTLDASGSYDPDGEALTYAWYQDGSFIGTDVVETIEALDVGTYEFMLLVSDGELTALDSCVVEVKDDTCSGNCCPNLAFLGSRDKSRATSRSLALLLILPLARLWRRRSRQRRASMIG